ncbi:hypothetical protein YC2023_119566 [Brassica napus]
MRRCIMCVLSGTAGDFASRPRTNHQSRFSYHLRRLRVAKGNRTQYGSSDFFNLTQSRGTSSESKIRISASHIITHDMEKSLRHLQERASLVTLPKRVSSPGESDLVIL